MKLPLSIRILAAAAALWIASDAAVQAAGFAMLDAPQAAAALPVSVSDAACFATPRGTLCQVWLDDGRIGPAHAFMVDQVMMDCRTDTECEGLPPR